MKKIVSLFGERSPLFESINTEVTEYAAAKGFAYAWAPQTPYQLDHVIELLNDADVGIIDVQPYDETVFRRLSPRCRLLVRFGVGFDQVDLAAASNHGLCITRTTGANKTGVAELALTQILAARRQIMLNRKTVESGVWVKNVGHELLGKRVGILGFGNVGQCLAKLLTGFQTEILVYDTFQDYDAAKALHARFASIEEIFSTCEAISVHLPYCPETHHLIGNALLSTMKDTAVIVCTARGRIIDEDALYNALANHRIAGAGLDVFAEEPYPANGKLIGLDNVILTPHVASQTYESLKAIYLKAVDISADFFDGKELSRSDLLNPEYRNHERK